MVEVAPPLQQSVDTVVMTASGRVRGRREGPIHAFRGIPYAAPPFGPDRFRAPRAAEAWTGIRDAVQFGPEPFQLRPPADHPAASMVWDPATAGEDCLNLNVWTPDPGTAGLPVMVWIPGGMFEVGTGATYDGSRFARDGIVLVTINSRVGAEGFVALDDAEPNRGLLDQVAALEWVRDNIRGFGGDPQNVTIFGESSGAMSVGTLLAMPGARGLFQRAICQSGAADRVIDARIARRLAAELATRLGVTANRAGFASVTPDRLVDAAGSLKDEITAHPDPARWSRDIVASMLPWQPMVDGEVVPAHPLLEVSAGSAIDVDLLVGWNSDDWRLFTIANGSYDRVALDDIVAPVERAGFETILAYGLTAEDVADYRAVVPGGHPGEILARVQSDWWCRVPGMRLAEAQIAAGGPARAYEFAWPSPAFDGQFGACHALEIPFVFDTLDLGVRQMQGVLLGDAPPQSLATAMHGAWVAFASTGDPGWPRYELDRRPTMIFDAVSRVVDDPRSFERRLWAGRL